MNKIGLFLLLSLPGWAQTAKTSDWLIQYFSNPNQRVEIKKDTLWVYWYEEASLQNPSEFRDTSAINLRMIADVKIIKGRNSKGQKGIGLQLYPAKTRAERSITNPGELSAEQLRQTNTASLAQKMQGQAAGVQIGNDNSPGGSSMVRIHGIGSINANGPLYVVDGVPLQGSINTINPNDVASVQVLKDPSQTAMYGVRGANGVILISTLKGTENPVEMPELTVLPLTIWSWGALSKDMHQERTENQIKNWLEGKQKSSSLR
jgi:TonB-dependent SusC/RagA subfamily outer membrane receptor